MRRSPLAILRVLVPTAILVVAAVACSGQDAQTPMPTDPMLSISRAGSIVAAFTVEVADDPAEQERGLMGRTDLATGTGMAFVWDDPVPVAFWMKDTLIPLDIAFWDADGRIVAIMTMQPCLADPCPTYDPGTPVVGALEVNAGELAASGVQVGDLVELLP